MERNGKPCLRAAHGTHDGAHCTVQRQLLLRLVPALLVAGMLSNTRGSADTPLWIRQRAVGQFVERCTEVLLGTPQMLGQARLEMLDRQAFGLQRNARMLLLLLSENNLRTKIRPLFQQLLCQLAKWVDTYMRAANYGAVPVQRSPPVMVMRQRIL